MSLYTYIHTYVVCTVMNANWREARNNILRLHSHFCIHEVPQTTLLVVTGQQEHWCSVCAQRSTSEKFLMLALQWTLDFRNKEVFSLWTSCLTSSDTISGHSINNIMPHSLTHYSSSDNTTWFTHIHTYILTFCTILISSISCDFILITINIYMANWWNFILIPIVEWLLICSHYFYSNKGTILLHKCW